MVAPIGCTVGPNFTRPKPALPPQWSSQSTAPAAQSASRVNSSAAELAPWWDQFKDPQLSSLIQRSRTSNLDVRQAVLRISEARTERDVTAAGLWPSVSVNASYSRSRFSDSTYTGKLFSSFGSFNVPGLPAVTVPNPYNQYQLGFGASWEIDLFGRLRRSIEASNADVEASTEDHRAVLISLDSDVARTYVDLRGAQLRKSVTEASLATEREVLELTSDRQAAGLTTDLDVADAAAQVKTTEAQLPQLELQITQDMNQLAKLMALDPEALRGELADAHPVPPVPPQIPIGLPADLARRRPDIREAEQKLHAATARVGVAVADLFPRLTLSAQGGVQSEGPGKLLDWASRFGSIGPTFEVPIFDRGRWVTVKLQDIRAQEAALAYAQTVLAALHEVENALAAYRADQERRAELAGAVDQSRDALDLARQRYMSGITNFLVVLDAERTLQQNDQSLAESITSVSADLVALYRTLGGAPTGGDESQ